MLGKCVVVLLDWLCLCQRSLWEQGRLRFCIIMPTVRDEDKEAAQARLRLAEFSGGGVWGLKP